MCVMPLPNNRTKTAAELLGVFNVPSEGRDRLVATAVELFYSYGFNAVGLDRILDEAGVSKTTFYKHFDSKDELMVAAVEMREKWESAAWVRAVRELAGDDPRARLIGMFDLMDMWFNEPDFRGCMFISAASEFPNPADPVHQAAARHKCRTRDGVCDLARQGGLTDPEKFADLYTLLFEGALVMRQVFGRNDAARTARGEIEQLVARFTPA
jgi:AcrR family transcriptional regulator